MKKIKQYLITFLTTSTLLLTPAGVYAQEVVEIPAETAETVSAPDTGIAPHDEMYKSAAFIFISGSALGALMGLSVVSLRKKRQL
jgi:hypothetical protein